MPKGSKKEQRNKKTATKLALARKGKAKSAGEDREPPAETEIAAAAETGGTSSTSPSAVPVHGSPSSAKVSHHPASTRSAASLTPLPVSVPVHRSSSSAKALCCTASTSSAAASQNSSPVPIPVQGSSSLAKASHCTAHATPASKPPFISPTMSGKKRT